MMKRGAEGFRAPSSNEEEPMSRYAVSLAGLLLLSPPASLRAYTARQADKAEARPLLETWQAAYFEGLKVGHMHTVAREVKRGGKKCIRTRREMNLIVKRYGSVIPVRIDQVSEETPEGKVLSLSTTQYLAKDSKKTLTGVVKGGKLALAAGDDEVLLPFSDKVVGYYHQETVFQKRKVKPGDRFEVVSYELLLPSALTLRLAVKDREKVDRLVPKKGGPRGAGGGDRREHTPAERTSKVIREPAALLRVEMVPDKIEVGDTPVQLPTTILWLDGTLTPVRQQFEMPGLGAIVLYTTTKAAALEEGVAPELLPDLGLKVSIPLEQTIEKPYETTRGVYRITLEEDIARVFTRDSRQEIRNQKGKTFELVVQARRAPVKVARPIEPKREYLESSQFIDSDNARVKARAKAVVGRETDDWRKALKLEKWVHDNMKVSSAVGFPSAGQICRDLEGDCRQHAILLAALCRAAGVPSRTAVGLIYVREAGRRPVFGFHMWTEVLVEGQWLALDAILGEGGVAATHLKMADHSWSKTATLAPLLPVSRALGKVKIAVLSTK
jgi:transglutaminase-like putative cysteine protease